VSPPKNCTDAEYTLVQKAIIEAGIINEQTRRALRHNNKGRKLPNCANLCGGKTYSACYQTTSGQCAAWWIANNGGDDDVRMLQEVEEAQMEPQYVVLDKLFDNASNGDEPTTGDRKLQTTAVFGVTEDMCNEYKKNLYLTVLSHLADVDTECANLLLSTNQMECIAIL
jgi:hypothetical protein